jgi:uncharacterized protein (DUF1015 family)
MAEIIPFRGILYNTSKVAAGDVLAPPYDIITPAYQKDLYNKSSHNIVRIDFGMEHSGDTENENKYTRARQYLDEWRREGVLVRSEHPSFYAYEISYTVDGHDRKLLGFLGLVRLEELGKGNIFPHECTYSKPKLDRLNLLRFCRANISPIFSLYKSPAKRASSILSIIAGKSPYFEARDDAGAVHRLWQIKDQEQISIIQEDLRDKKIFIADGHHRYETAFEYQRESRESHPLSSGAGSTDYVMMFLANMADEGLTILPTHRLIKEFPEDIGKFSEYFDFEPVVTDFDITRRLSGRRYTYGFFRNNEAGWQVLRYKGLDFTEIHPDLRDIDVIILHDLILKKLFGISDIGYEMDVGKTLENVRNGQFQAAFFLNPTRVEDVEKAALSAVRMPPKSTYFYPKLLTGVVINCFE